MTATATTAVIPTIGRIELRQAVASVLAQTQPTPAVVVVAQPSRREAVLEQLDGLDGDVEVLVAERELGGGAARNLGLERVTTPLVAFLDDDDWWHPEKIATQSAAISASREPTICSTDSAFGTAPGDDTTGDRLASRRVPTVRFDAPPGARIADYLLARPRLRYGHHFLQTSSLLMPTDLARAARWDESLAKHQDWDFLIRVVDRLGARHLPVPELLSYVRQGSAASVSRRLDWRASLAWLESIEVGTRSRNDFLLSVVVRPSLMAGDRDGVSAGLRAIHWSRPPRLASALGTIGAAATARRTA